MAVIAGLNELTPDKALIFRVTHIENVAWILDHGLHCKASNVQDPDFVAIGNPDLIQKRQRRSVLAGTGGTLDHYIPFYFTPCSVMLFNLRTGWNGMTRRTPQELVFFVASLRTLDRCGIPFVFSDRHAFMQWAKFWTSLDHLDNLPWTYWQERDFKQDPDHPEKKERYQAEALVHRHLRSEYIDAIVCGDEDARARVDGMVRHGDCRMEIVCRRSWFF